MAHEQLVLPLSVVSQGDAMRLSRELEVLSDYIHQSELRKSGSSLKSLPKLSATLNEFTEENRINLLKNEDRNTAAAYLKSLVENAPIVHISFASEPSSRFMNKVTKWFRQEIDSRLLINVGLEPSIAAGFTLRTLNHYHDFSLRQQFSDQRELLLNGIKEPLESKSA
jgi:F0F1-type ATP synthase delta subunit